MAACTPTKTVQEDDTCRFHTVSRMIVNVVFDPLLPMSPAELKLYEDCMPLKTPVTPEILASYSEERCSRNGYIKIMLFYYFFELAQRTGVPTLQGTVIQDFLALEPLHVPGINEEAFAHLRGTFDPHWFGFHIQLDDEDLFPEIQERAIRPILLLSGYLELGLEDDKPKGKRGRQQHMVLIVGEDERGIHIKNSWGKLLDIKPFQKKIIFGGIGEKKDVFNAIDLFFILPVASTQYSFHPFNMDLLYDLLSKIQPRLSKGGKKRKTKYGQRRNHHQSKAIRASRKRPKTYHKRRLSKH